MSAKLYRQNAAIEPLGINMINGDPLGSVAAGNHAKYLLINVDQAESHAFPASENDQQALRKLLEKMGQKGAFLLSLPHAGIRINREILSACPQVPRYSVFIVHAMQAMHLMAAHVSVPCLTPTGNVSQPDAER